MYHYDIYGWLTTEVIPDRRTDVPPPQETESLKANWTGSGWVLVEYAAPPEMSAPVNPTEWLIDIGSFFDRFGAAKMAVLMSADAGVQAIIKDTQVRKWLDLKLPEVAQSLVYVAGKVPEVTPELQDSIINTPVSDHENLSLRRLYFP